MAEIVIDERGTKYYFNDETQFHRDDGPAIIHKDGSKSWYVNGEANDPKNPSVFFANGIFLWYRFNHHRSDGPSEVRPNGYKEWYEDGSIIWPKLG